jgi:hypothetical protein
MSCVKAIIGVYVIADRHFPDLRIIAGGFIIANSRASDKKEDRGAGREPGEYEAGRKKA